jgi:uncharacterized protein (DUF433 family)
MRGEKELIAHYVEENPHRPGVADVRLVSPYGVPVWAIVGYLDVVEGNLSQVAEDYLVPVEAVKAALAYYRQHKAVIDARISANAA